MLTFEDAARVGALGVLADFAKTRALGAGRRIDRAPAEHETHPRPGSRGTHLSRCLGHRAQLGSVSRLFFFPLDVAVRLGCNLLRFSCWE